MRGREVTPQWDYAAQVLPSRASGRESAWVVPADRADFAQSRAGAKGDWELGGIALLRTNHSLANMSTPSRTAPGEVLTSTWGDTLSCCWTAGSCWFMAWQFYVA